MKTEEELKVLRDEVAQLSEKLSELSEEELEEVTGGTAFSAGSYADSVFVHDNCGGEILNVGNPFSYCVCSKCGERHYWHFSFDYTVVHTNQ